MYQMFLASAQDSLKSLSSDELKELLNDDNKLENSVNDALAQLEAEKDEILNENRGQAETNLTKEPRMLELRGIVNELSEEGKSICASVQEKLNEIQSKSGNMNQDTALAKLEVAALESEEESEKIVKSFLDNEMPLEAFLEQFLSSRKTMHLRKLKVEKMKDIIRNPTLNYNNSFFPNSFGGRFAGNTPYPLGQMQMQMPMPGLPRPY